MKNTLEYLKENKRCVKRGKHLAVYQDPTTGLYEIWDRYEQYDWTESKQEALEILKYEEQHYYD